MCNRLQTLNYHIIFDLTSVFILEISPSKHESTLKFICNLASSRLIQSFQLY